VISLPPHLMNQMIQALAQLKINCGIYEMHIKCMNFQSLSDMQNVFLALEFGEANKLHIISAETLV
jgi:hypothetical protein